MFVSQNRSPFLAEAFVSTDKMGVKSLVAVVRGTFDVGSDGTATVSEMQLPFVFADKHFGDPVNTAVQLESEFVPVKPRAEVLLNAVAAAPGARPVTELEVILHGPGLQKRAIVTGERYWIAGAVGVRATPARPFQTMPLAWHLAFGGTDATHDDPRQHRSELRNPIGQGFHINASANAIDGAPLPCVEHPSSRMQSWSDTPEPLGYGPVSRFAQSRVRFAGTYDQQWMDHVLPFLPHDFDLRYFQAAPEDQQVDSLAPGVEFACLNMSADGPFLVRLPTFRVRVHFMFDDKTVIKLTRPDTVILEPHERRIVMLGRVGIDLPRKFTRLREVQIDLDQMSHSDKPRYASLADLARARHS